MEKIVEVGMPAEQVESLMQVKLSQLRIELQTHFKSLLGECGTEG